MPSVEEEILTAALEYAAYGWRVLPLHARGKRPYPDAWQKAATSQEDVIQDWWRQWPDANLGVKLGPESGIIDIECDSEEAERTLLNVFQGNFPVTPTFQASRGKHRLFRWREGLPNPQKGIFHIGPLEFRTGNGAKGAQSVFPPSVHATGARYAWLVHPDEAPPVDLEESILVRIWNSAGEDLFSQPANGHAAKPAEHWERIAAGVGHGSRNMDAASLIGVLLRDLKDPFNADSVARIWEMVKIWNTKNKPPLDSDELERTFKSILQRDRSGRTEELVALTVNSERTWSPKEESGVVPQWKLVIVESRPRVYRLYSPLWSLKAPRGFIELTAADMHSPDAIRRGALEQADVWVNRAFNKRWDGDKDHPSLARQLIETAAYEPAPLEAKRDLVVAELLWDQIAKARPVDEQGQPDKMGRPSRLPDGGVLFKFSYVWEPMARGDDKVKRAELSALLKELGVEDQGVRATDSTRRYKHLSPKSVSRLKELIGIL